MAAQKNDIIYAERSGIPGTVTADEIAKLAYTVTTQAAYDALSPPDANTLYIIIG